METFVNREAALRDIGEALEALLDKKRLLRTPIIDFYGIGGIGKTFFLKEVQQRCQDKQLYCLWADASQNITAILREIVRQVRGYGVAPPFEDGDTNLLYESISAVRILLKREPVIILFDDIDTSNTAQQSWLGTLLRELSDANNVFVVVTSKRKLSFENDHSLARRLKLFPLPPFDRPACEAYLAAFSTQIDSELRSHIFTWTHGFPVALHVIAQAVVSGVDPRQEQGLKEIVARLTDQVLNQIILVNVEPARLGWYHTLLALLSVPRHFNLVLLQDLIERFTPQLALENSLAYFGLPREIIQATEVLNWNTTGTGFSVDMPVRTLLLLKLKVEQPEQYYKIHRFLAQTNRQWAADVQGADRVRYLCEYFYHSASSENTATLEQFLISTIQEIAEAYPESFAQFAGEVTQDEDLKELLDEHQRSIESLIHKNLVRIYRNLAAASSGVERINNLRQAFDHVLSDPDVNDLSLLLKETIQQVIQQEQPEITFKLYKELARDRRFRTALGEDFENTFIAYSH